MTPTCKRCPNVPTAPTREYGDTRWPASIAGYCIECVWVIVQEWEAYRSREWTGISEEDLERLRKAANE